MQQLQQYGPQILEREKSIPVDRCLVAVGLKILALRQIFEFYAIRPSSVSPAPYLRIYDSIIKFRTTSKFLKRRIFYD
ncbi:hypothetical protein DTO195F2_4101 [Paecilomyces variotii]|nr:hypothetical protein DTO195F2_4101 [Paecilomyces variotii]